MKIKYLFSPKRCAALCFCALALAALTLAAANLHASAEEDNHGFIITAQHTSSANTGAYNVNITISSTERDWEGTVRLTINSSNYYDLPCAYDTLLSLPQGSEKQFTVQIPRASLWESDGTVEIQVLDSRGEVLAQKEFRKLISDGSNMLPMGILSDSYDALTALDLGGNSFYYSGVNYPLKLYELDDASLDDMLPGLLFLVIDHFDIGVLTPEQLTAIQDWVNDGGTLIVGTGEYALETTTGIADFLGMEIALYSAEEEFPDPDFDSTDDYFDLQKYTLAKLTAQHSDYTMSYSLQCYMRPEGMGSLCVLPYSLTEVSEKGDFTEEYASLLLDTAADQSYSRYSNPVNSDSFKYASPRLLNIINGKNNSLNITALNLIIVVYIILAGPVLYLCLRLIKKREAYWIAVPAISFLFVLLVFFAGRGFKIVHTTVNSVSVAAADGQGDTTTYLHCYNADYDEWSLKLKDTYAAAGPAFSQYNYNSGTMEYYYHIVKNGQNLLFGAKPDSPFEDVYFCAQGSNPNNCSIDASGMVLSDGNATAVGTLANNTPYDFSYVAVVCNNQLALYESLGAGRELDLAQQLPVYTDTAFTDLDTSYIYRLRSSLFQTDNKTDWDKAGKVAALALGIGTVYSENPAFVIGVVEDYDKAVDDNCQETSYGCLYTYLEP